MPFVERERGVWGCSYGDRTHANWVFDRKGDSPLGKEITFCSATSHVDEKAFFFSPCGAFPLKISNSVESEKQSDRKLFSLFPADA